ncbi:cytochrome P450 [Neoconidiobolus thromboides FSU 785]|nr:cytochrome P450 [Neoconidiobolus thromboides FSU 785]
MHTYIKGLHEKYGEVVRLSANSITFSSDEVTKELYSTYALPKSTFYYGFHITGETILSTTNKDFHRQRKKILAASFSDKTIASVEYLVKENVDNLVNKVREMASEEKNFDFGLLFHYFSFDVIGDLAYGKSFDMIKNGYHPVIGWIKDYFRIVVLVGILPVLKNYAFESVTKLYKFSYEAVKNVKEHSDRVTILSTLINASDPDTGKKLSEKEIVEESIIQLVAGSDTTSNSLTWTFYLLSKHPEVYSKLKMELFKNFPDEGSITYSRCKECVYLKAVIYESMRILPAISGNMPRAVQKGGKVIEGYFIPENTIVSISVIALHNNPNYWKDPHVFNPGRWVDEYGSFKPHRYFMPFSIGPRACLGRSLAWMELYLATASLVRNFSFKLKDESDVKSKLHVVTIPEKPINMSAFQH